MDSEADSVVTPARPTKRRRSKRIAAKPRVIRTSIALPVRQHESHSSVGQESDTNLGEASYTESDADANTNTEGSTKTKRPNKRRKTNSSAVQDEYSHLTYHQWPRAKQLEYLDRRDPATLSKFLQDTVSTVPFIDSGNSNLLPLQFAMMFTDSDGLKLQQNTPPLPKMPPPATLACTNYEVEIGIVGSVVTSAAKDKKATEPKGFGKNYVARTGGAVRLQPFVAAQTNQNQSNSRMYRVVGSDGMVISQNRLHFFQDYTNEQLKALIKDPRDRYIQEKAKVDEEFRAAMKTFRIDMRNWLRDTFDRECATENLSIFRSGVNPKEIQPILHHIVEIENAREDTPNAFYSTYFGRPNNFIMQPSQLTQAQRDLLSQTQVDHAPSPGEDMDVRRMINAAFWNHGAEFPDDQCGDEQLQLRRQVFRKIYQRRQQIRDDTEEKAARLKERARAFPPQKRLRDRANAILMMEEEYQYQETDNLYLRLLQNPKFQANDLPTPLGGFIPDHLVTPEPVQSPISSPLLPQDNHQAFESAQSPEPIFDDLMEQDPGLQELKFEEPDLQEPAAQEPGTRSLHHPTYGSKRPRRSNLTDEVSSDYIFAVDGDRPVQTMPDDLRHILLTVAPEWFHEIVQNSVIQPAEPISDNVLPEIVTPDLFNEEADLEDTVAGDRLRQIDAFLRLSMENCDLLADPLWRALARRAKLAHDSNERMTFKVRYFFHESKITKDVEYKLTTDGRVSEVKMSDVAQIGYTVHRLDMLDFGCRYDGYGNVDKVTLNDELLMEPKAEGPLTEDQDFEAQVKARYGTNSTTYNKYFKLAI